jgi:hypothetical protein
MDLPDDDHLHRAVIELGEPQALFRISHGRFLAKLALGVMLVLYGLGANYFWWVHGPGTFGHFEILFLLVPPVSGISLLVHMYRHRGLFVLIYPSGLLRLRRGEVDSFPWHEVEFVRVRVQRAEVQFTRDPDGSPTACWLPVDVPTFKLGDAGLSVVRTDGVEGHFGPALSHYDVLAEEVQKRTFAALWSSARDRFRDGDRIGFGDLEADRFGLHHNGKLLRWRELKELNIAQGKLSLKQSGKWLPWVLVDMGSVSNPHLLFALVDQVQRHGPPPRNEPNPRGVGQQREE